MYSPASTHNFSSTENSMDVLQGFSANVLIETLKKLETSKSEKKARESAEKDVYVLDCWMKNIDINTKLELIKNCKGNCPPEFVFHYLAQIFCPSMKDTIGIKKKDGQEMTKDEKRCISDMFNQASKDTSVLLEDIQCMLLEDMYTESSDTCLDMVFNCTVTINSNVTVQGEHMFSWFIQYYVCTIVFNFIMNNVSIKKIHHILERSNHKFNYLTL